MTRKELWAKWTAPNGETVTYQRTVPILGNDNLPTGKKDRERCWAKDAGHVKRGGRGGAMQILPYTAGALAICEGVVDALAAMSLSGYLWEGCPEGEFFRMGLEQAYGINRHGKAVYIPACPVWATGGAQNIASFQWPEKTTARYILADRDPDNETGQKAATKAALEHGAEIIFPPKGNKDWNEYLNKLLTESGTK
jgi:hypothetical protein